MAGATPVFVTLRPPDYRLDVDALRAAVTPRTRLLLVNSPHNPTGTVLDRAELEAVAAVARGARPARRHRRGLRAPDLRRRRARPAGHVARDARAHAHRSRLAARRSHHRVEGRLGLRAGRAGHGGDDREAVPHLRQRRAAAAGDRDRARAARRLLHEPGRPARHPARRAVRRARDGGVRRVPTPGHLLRHRRHPAAAARRRRDGVLPGAARGVRRRGRAQPVFYADPSTGRHLVRFSFAKRPAVLEEAAARLGKLAREEVS